MASATGRTVPELLQDIVGNIQEIIRSEFRLAKAELKQEGAKVKAPATMAVVGGAFALYALGFLLLSATMALAIVVAWWMAALIVGVVLTIIAVVLLSTASKRLKLLNPPERTIETMKENVQWAKDRTR
jgi:uncharacterized membrane protein YqjE